MSLIEHIKHYQRSIDRSEHDRDRIVYCLGKLYSMPITVDDLKKTGVGKTVNALRKWDGEAGEAARALIGKWRDMVEAEDDDVEEEEEENVADSGNEEDYRETEEDENDAIQHREDGGSDEAEQPQEEEVEERHQEREYGKYRRESNRETENKHRKYYSEDDTSSNDKNEHEKSETRDTSRTSSRERSEHKSKSKDRHHKEHKHRDKGLKRKNNQETDDSQINTKETNDAHRSKTKDKHRDHNKDKHSKSDRHKHSSSSSSKKDKHNDDASHSSKQKSDKHKSKHRETSSRYEEESSEESVKETSKIQVPSVSSSNHSDKSKHRSSKDHKSSKRTRSDDNLEKQSKKIKIKDSEIEGINSYSGASFAEALGMMDESVSYSTSKKKSASSSLASSNCSNQSSIATTSTAIPKPDLLVPGIKLPNLDLDITLPTISTNYKPLPHEFERKPSHRPLGMSQEEALEIVMSSKNQRTKVFSGNKCSAGVVSSLYDICIRVLQENIDALEYTGGVPYSILLPILERATPEQLFQLEHHNAYLLEDTDELWQQHCVREFRNRKREELESWREAYSRFLSEREAKLRALTANIKQNQVEKLAPVRQTKLAYVDSVVKPPRSIARKQAKMGTASACNTKPLISPAARAAALSTAGATVAVPNPVRVAAPSTSNLKPKKAPLMQKMLTQIKKTNRYRR